MTEPTAPSTMREVVGLWYVGRTNAANVVYAACDLLAAGHDGPSLRMLAAVSIGQADLEVPYLLEAALQDIGLRYHPQDSPAAQEAGLRAMASQTLSGAITPRELTAWVHGKFGHTRLELAEALADLDDAYDTAFTATDREHVDAEVLAEARSIIEISPGEFA